jgi:hypothetical protein
MEMTTERAGYPVTLGIGVAERAAAQHLVRRRAHGHPEPALAGQKPSQGG